MAIDMQGKRGSNKAHPRKDDTKVPIASVLHASSSPNVASPFVVAFPLKRAKRRYIERHAHIECVILKPSHMPPASSDWRSRTR